MEIGKYTTVGVRLGQGAFGTVELATDGKKQIACLLYTSPSPRDRQKSRMPSSA